MQDFTTTVGSATNKIKNVSFEKAVLVQVFFKKTNYTDYDKKSIILEANLLAESAKIDVLETIEVNKEMPTSKYFLGEGKVLEIKELVTLYDLNLVLFNHDLSPAQTRNLENLLDCKVIDRTTLILDIFAQRAKTYIGRLQVELAQLTRLYTRLVKGWSHLERQKGGIGLRGPGETQLETDRRLVRNKILFIKGKLAEIESQKKTQKNDRLKNSIPTVVLVGYTNAGKSTLFNTLTNENIYAKDQLFATLDPTVRYINIPSIGDVALIDTVGFIQDLPHDLVEAFKSTLQEVADADLLLHVVDIQDDGSKIATVNKVLKEIDADLVKKLLVYNKIDAVSPRVEAKLGYNSNNEINSVFLSALLNEGIDQLKLAIAKSLTKKIFKVTVQLPFGKEELKAVLYRGNLINTETVDEHGYLLDLTVADGYLKYLTGKYTALQDYIINQQVC